MINSSYLCDDSKLELVIRNNINGDYSKIKKLTEIEPGAIINIDWNNKKIMLPYNLRKDYISFTDKKWDWRYKISKDGSLNNEKPAIFELLPSGETKEHLCKNLETS